MSTGDASGLSGAKPPANDPPRPANDPPYPASQDVRLARAAWSRLAEPGDAVAGAVVAALGPVDALAWVRDAAQRPDAALARLGDLTGPTAARLGTAVARWAPRLEGLAPGRDLEALERRGGTLLVPGASGWPVGLDALGPAAPLALWVIGPAVLPGATDGPGPEGARGAVAVIGARAATAYGEHVAGEIATGLGDDGVTVVSGGAYGIDAVAHRAALAGGRPTVAVMAGGVDRPYPAGNARLLGAVAESGALLSEVPLGAVPSRSRFLQRNRLIAALAGVTVVVEAAWRSGALSTAAHAARLLRPVGAVPGPVTSALSAGCHRLLRDGAAVCVTDAGDVLELLRAVGSGPDGAEEAREVRRPDGLDDLDPGLREVLEALPCRGGSTVDRLARVAGRGVAEVRAALGRLELEGRVTRTGEVWRRRRA